MVYEWDARRARRLQLTRRFLALAAVVLALAFPIWILMNFGLLG